jgi:hypothetical protein
MGPDQIRRPPKKLLPNNLLMLLINKTMLFNSLLLGHITHFFLKNLLGHAKIRVLARLFFLA